MKPAALLAALFTMKTAEVAAKTQLLSTVVRLGNVAYYLHPLPQLYGLDAPTFENGQSAQPCTVLTLEGDGPIPFQTIFQDFDLADDVWSSDFSQSVVIQMLDTGRKLTKDDEDTLRGLGVKELRSFRRTSSEANLPQGPYFLHHGHLHQAYRLYPDPAGAFMISTVPDDNGGFRPLDAAAYGEQFPSALTVAVPSRLYYKKTTKKPYAGLRLAVKDIIDLKGLKTGASSRAYTELYPTKEATAETVQRLIDLGFVIVGKLKSTQFADSEWPTCDYVDYHGPFNPRGDGYLTPSGSSSGSASAISTYQWLDFSLGTDTLGSIRSPAAAQALFAMRPTHGATSTKGIVPYSPKWDTIGGFARTAAEYSVLAQALYGSAETNGKTYKKPTKLIYPTDYWPVADGPSQTAFETFITRVEDFLGVKRTRINLADTWANFHPEGTDESISKYMYNAFDWSANRDQWHGLLKPFIEEYTTKFGKRPVLNPQVRFKVDYTPTVTEEQQAEGVKRLKTYRDWFYEHVMPAAKDGYSSSIMVLPWTTGEPDYRDKYKDGPQEFTGQGFFFYNVGPYANCPELIFPIGNTPYTSKYTGKLEDLPAALGLIGAEGSDVMLADFVSKIFEHTESTAKSSQEQSLSDEL